MIATINGLKWENSWTNRSPMEQGGEREEKAGEVAVVAMTTNCSK